MNINVLLLLNLRALIKWENWEDETCWYLLALTIIMLGSNTFSRYRTCNIEIYKALQVFTFVSAKCYGSKQWILPNTNGIIVISLGWCIKAEVNLWACMCWRGRTSLFVGYPRSDLARGCMHWTYYFGDSIANV